MKHQQLYLKVHPYLWEYYRGFYGREIIDVKEHPLLAIPIKAILQTQPKNYSRRKWSDFRIIVLNLPYFRLGNKAINIEFRKFLDDRRQFLISQELYGDFKNAFHNFVMGYVLSGGKQMDGIKEFCSFYNFEMNQIKLDSLKKSWDRCDLKQKWKDEENMLINVKYSYKKIDTVSSAILQ